jgi:hypothetical protein
LGDATEGTLLTRPGRENPPVPFHLCQPTRSEARQRWRARRTAPRGGRPRVDERPCRECPHAERQRGQGICGRGVRQVRGNRWAQARSTSIGTAARRTGAASGANVTGARAGTRTGTRAGNTPAVRDRGKAAGSHVGGFLVRAQPNASYYRKVRKRHPA